MAGVMNNSARAFNLKTKVGNERVHVRLNPGFNVIPDDYWQCFVKGKDVHPFVAHYAEKGDIVFGDLANRKVGQVKPETKTAVKRKPEKAPAKK